MVSLARKEFTRSKGNISGNNWFTFRRNDQGTRPGRQGLGGRGRGPDGVVRLAEGELTRSLLYGRSQGPQARRLQVVSVRRTEGPSQG